MRPAVFLAALALTAFVAVPAHAFPTNVAAPDISVDIAKGLNVVHWTYPDGIKGKDVNEVEVWRFDGLATANFVVKVKPHTTSVKDPDGTNPDAFYTVRFFTKDGRTSDFSPAKNSKYPYCSPWLVFGSVPPTRPPQIFLDCLVPPAAMPYVDQGMVAAQRVIG